MSWFQVCEQVWVTGVSFGEFGLNIESHWGLSKSISLSLKGQTDPGRRWKAVFENRNWDLQLIQINFPEQTIGALSRQRKEVSGARYYFLLLTFVLSDKKIISCFVTESPQISQLFLHTPNAHSYLIILRTFGRTTQKVIKAQDVEACIKRKGPFL